MSEGNNIVDLFSARFKDAEAAPSHDVWEKLESRLDGNSVEGIYQAAFENAAVQPSASVWKRISAALAWKSFLTFRYNTFNIYYASILTAILGLTGVSALRDSEAADSLEDEKAVEAERPSSGSKTILTDEDVVILAEDFTESSSESAAENNEVAGDGQTNSEEGTAAEEDRQNPGKDPKNGKADEEGRTVDWSFVRIAGANSICKDIPAVYAIEGLTTHADVKWHLPRAAKRNSEFGHSVSVSWQESGAQAISVDVKIGSEKKTFTCEVAVEEVAVPVIKGKAKVCQGMTKQLYSVGEANNNEIQFLWEARQNPIDHIGNRYINIDWTKSGKDTITVTKINTVTGCKSTASMAVVIYPQPKIDFEFYPLGESEYEFAFTETQRKGYSYEWMVEGMEYSEPVFTHTASGANSSFASLKVTDKNGCISFVQKEVDFNKNFIVVPSKFTPGSGKYFVPFTNADLRSYKLEIYNARNEKIWETSELSNGKPSLGWDGRFRGAALPRGKYMWKISATFDDGSQWKGVTQPNGSCKPSGIFVLEE